MGLTRMAMGLGRVLMTGGVVALAVMFGSGAVRLSRILVVLGSVRMSFLGHGRLHCESTYVPLSNGLNAVTVALLAAC